MSAVPFYQGAFGKEQAERLLWRAGFGAREGEAEALAQRGLTAAVQSLTRPASQTLVGPDPTDEKGRALQPSTIPGHDHLWWLDRMVRTTAPAVERMTLVWHSWFATSNLGVQSQQLMLNQNELFRQNALGSFGDILNGVTVDPAMLVWLNGNQNVKSHPNENYGREMMELFTLGANRGAYTETDVRENARALTGWRGSVSAGQPFIYDPNQHDTGTKTIFGQSGNFDYHDSCRLCLAHPLHPSYFVLKLWSYFIPVRYDATTLHALTQMYANGNQILPVVEAILTHPLFYEGPRMVKPPVVFNAGLLRMRGEYVNNSVWSSLGQQAGQQLFYPPDVGGWDYTRWLNSATYRSRWFIAALVQGAGKPTDSPTDPSKLWQRSIQFWGFPTVSAQTQALVEAFAKAQLKRGNDPADVETAMRRLIGSSPDLQTA
ncbi:MAG: DUF1800 domain-containing protein [Actinobacteria bacterium]|nr:DUF1800 domain-containing protein [Actinomycetota bacterium]MBV8394916.1 DUF1800 domain-containing protein [Actinomycetota bacterium]MBV8598262.1 DUF1800 domain-containing protein [Actinomycetota bacterium]